MNKVGASVVKREKNQTADSRAERPPEDRAFPIPRLERLTRVPWTTQAHGKNCPTLLKRESLRVVAHAHRRSWTCRHGRGQLGLDRRPTPARLSLSSGEVAVHVPSQQMTRVIGAVAVHHSSIRRQPLQQLPFAMGALPHHRRRRPPEPLQHPGLPLVAPPAAGSSIADEGLQHPAILLAAPR